MTTTPPDPDVAAPDVADTVQLMHRRRSWARLGAISLITSALAYGGYADADSREWPWMARCCGAGRPRSGRRPPRSPRITAAASVPTTTRPGTGSCGSSAGSG